MKDEKEKLKNIKDLEYNHLLNQKNSDEFYHTINGVVLVKFLDINKMFF